MSDAPMWIPCSKELPPMGEWVLVRNDYSYRGVLLSDADRPKNRCPAVVARRVPEEYAGAQFADDEQRYVWATRWMRIPE